MEKTCDNCGDKCNVESFSLMCKKNGFSKWKPKETGIKEVVFGPEHVGHGVSNVDYGNGYIVSYNSSVELFLPVRVKFENGRTVDFTKGGSRCKGGVRSIFIGHNAKINIEEDDLPEKLICPVCGVEHDIYDSGNLAHFETNDFGICPFENAAFANSESAKEAMRNLIKAMS